MIRVFTTAALALALGATAVSPSFAQAAAGQTGPMTGMMGGSCPTMGMMMGQGMMGQGQNVMGRQAEMGAMAAHPGAEISAMLEGRLAYLKSALAITDAQADAWNAYAEAVKERGSLMQDMRQAMMEAMQKGSATERIHARIQGMEAMVDAMKAVQPATDKLYTALSDEQKKIADGLIGIDCGAM